MCSGRLSSPSRHSPGQDSRPGGGSDAGSVQPAGACVCSAESLSINNWRRWSLPAGFVHHLWSMNPSWNLRESSFLSGEKETRLYFNLNSVKLHLCICFHPEVLSVGVLVSHLHGHKLSSPRKRFQTPV